MKSLHRLNLVTTGAEVFESVSTFSYLGDVIVESGGCGDAITARTTSASNVFKLLLHILTNRNISHTNPGNVFNACVRGLLLYNADDGMIRWMCGVKPEQKI